MTFRALDGTSITTLRALVDSVPPEGTFLVAVEGDARSGRIVYRRECL